MGSNNNHYPTLESIWSAIKHIDGATLLDAKDILTAAKFFPKGLNKAAVTFRTTSLINQFCIGTPAQLLVGVTQFMGLPMCVAKKVLLPRPETERLVEIMLLDLKTHHNGAPVRILELGAGTGAIALSLAKFYSNCQVYSWDISKKAIRLSEKNKQHLNIPNVTFIHNSFFSDVPRSWTQESPIPTYVVSNPPYIPTDTCLKLSPSVLQNDPKRALNGGNDGLYFHRRLIQIAARTQWPLYLEIGFDQGPHIKTLAENAGCSSTIFPDYSGLDRVAIVRSHDVISA